MTFTLGVLVLLATSCRYGFDRIAFDATADDSRPAGVRWRPPRTLTELGGPTNQGDPTLTADLLTIVWARNVTATTDDDLWTATRAAPSDPFMNLTPLTNLNSPLRDYSPEISPDGNTLYFSSDRNAQTSFYVSRRSGTVWSAPVLLTELSSNGYDGDLALTPDLLTVVFGRSAGFFRADRTDPTQPFGLPVLVPDLGPPVASIASPTLGTDAGVVYFHGNVPRDLFVAHWNGVAYDPAVPVVELNTALRDADPFITGDESYMIYVCDSTLCETTPE